jgi:hypothetical protein
VETLPSAATPPSETLASKCGARMSCSIYFPSGRKGAPEPLHPAAPTVDKIAPPKKKKKTSTTTKRPDDEDDEDDESADK